MINKIEIKRYSKKIANVKIYETQSNFPLILNIYKEGGDLSIYVENPLLDQFDVVNIVGIITFPLVFKKKEGILKDYWFNVRKYGLELDLASADAENPPKKESRGLILPLSEKHSLLITADPDGSLSVKEIKEYTTSNSFR